MKTLRYFFRLVFAFVLRFRWVLLMGVGIGVLMFFASLLVSNRIFGRSTEKIGVTGRFHTDDLPNVVLSDIGNGLTKVNESGIPEPDLALSWETPDEGKTWIFTLAENIYWHDHTPLTSQSVVYEFSDLEIETPDDRTIIFKLEDPFAPFPGVVSKPTFRQGLIGTGQWKVDKVTVVGSYVSELILTDEKMNKRIYKFYPTEAGTKLAYKKGEVSKIIEIFDPKPLDTWDTVNVTENDNLDKMVSLFFNTQDSLLSDKSARQALIYAIDKTAFSRERAISPISSSSWAYNSQVKRYDYDPDRAKELLDSIPEQLKNQPIKIVSTPLLLEEAEVISDYWRGVGIESIVQVSSIIPAEFQVYLTVFDTPEDPDQYSVWHSTQEASNISKYSNERIDKLLEDGRTELNLEERKGIYLDFQRFLVEDSPAAFLYHPKTFTLTRH